MGQLLQAKCLWKFENHSVLHMLSLGEMATFQLRNKLLLSMRTWKIIQFGGGAIMLAAFSFTFIIWMHIVLHIKFQIWIDHISQTTNWIFMKFVHGIHNSMMNNYGKFQLNPVHGFQENDHHHLQPIHIFIKIRDVGLSNFLCGDTL